MMANARSRVLLRGGRILDPATGRDAVGDLWIDGAVIGHVGDPVGATDGVETIDVSGLVVVPGLFDMHVHFREPGNEEVETIRSGARSAIAGGVTSVACFPNTDPALDNEAAAEFVVLQGKRAGYANVFPVGAVTLGRAGERLSEMGGLHRAGAVAFSDADRTVRSAEIMRRGLLYANMFRLPVIAHCEDTDLSRGGVVNYGRVALRLGLPGIPDVSEDIVVARDIRLAAITQGRLHLGHISTRDAVAQLREAKSNGLHVTGEVTPPHFTLTEETVSTYDSNFKVRPPLRSKDDVDALVAGVADGTIDVIASGHAPHAVEDKDVEFIQAPPGVVGLETLFAVAYTELVLKRRIPFLSVLEKMTINPARILGKDDLRGSLEPGKVADVSVFDVDTEYAIDPNRFQSKSRNTCFGGKRVWGAPRFVFVGGQCVLRDGAVVSSPEPQP